MSRVWGRRARMRLRRGLDGRSGACRWKSWHGDGGSHAIHSGRIFLTDIC